MGRGEEEHNRVEMEEGGECDRRKLREKGCFCAQCCLPHCTARVIGPTVRTSWSYCRQKVRNDTPTVL